MKRTVKYALLLFALPLIIGSCTQQQSYIEEYTETILTYPFSDTSPLPIIQTKNDIYPYSRVDGFSHDGQAQEWKMVKLENEYVEVYILPEQGGKVWGAVDKKTGKEFIYQNDVVKFRDVAMRGPWTSGGIEWNSGVIGHHPGGASPVNYRVFTDDKGTAHCVVGGMDLPSHMQWRVDISLPVNTSYFETQTNWYNATPYYQAYYHWNNAAVKSAEDLRFYFPGNYRLGHGGLADPWPVDENGVDRSWYKNNPHFGHMSYHIAGSMDNYYVCYYQDEDFGSGHWSPGYGAPGKKIWMWSHARDGAIWEDLLSDTHGQYVEVQAGRMLNQNSFSSGHTPFKQPNFIPYNADSWVERWFPVRETGGVTRVAESGTIHLVYSEEGMSLLFSPMKEISDNLAVLVDENEVLSEALAMLPSETREWTFEGITEEDKLEVYLGREKLFSSAEDYIMDRPFVSPSDALDDAYILARELENRRAYGRALDTYLELIEKDAMHLEAKARVAELYARRGELDKADLYVRKVLEMDAYLPGANFIYGNIQKSQGNFKDALDGFRWAMRSLEYRSASLQLLSEISLMEGNLDQALEQATQALSFNDKNLNSHKILAIAHRNLNHQKKAEEILAVLLEMDPLNHFALFETYLLQPGPGSLEAFNQSFQSEMARDEYLETGLFYKGLGLFEEAVKVLEEAPAYPVIDYWLAWLHRDDQEKSSAFMEKALYANPAYVFPYRTETLSVLEWASEQSSSWITDYYASLILWNRGRDAEAQSLLSKWGEEPDFVPFYYSRACLAGLNSDAALKDMRRALSIDPDQWRIYRILADIYNQRGDNASALALTARGHEKFPGNYILDLSYSKFLTINGDYKQSQEVLRDINVLPFEGENTGHDLYEYNNLILAYNAYKSGDYAEALDYVDLSEAYPENLGSGKPSYPDYRDQNQLRVLIYGKTGESVKSREAQEKIDEYTRKFGKKRGRSIFGQQFSTTVIQPF